MSVKENMDLILQVYDLTTRKDTDLLFRLYEPNYIEHTGGSDASLEQLKKGTAFFFAAFPDTVFTVSNMVAEDDKVAFQVTVTGTHKGQYMGLAPTGNRIKMIDTSIKRIANGRLAESWGTLDLGNLMQQLGISAKR